MTVKANKRTLEKLGRKWIGRPFADDDEFQVFADEQGTVNFIARLAIAEHEFLGDINVMLEMPDEEMDRRVDDIFAAARAVCKMKR